MNKARGELVRSGHQLDLGPHRLMARMPLHTPGCGRLADHEHAEAIGARSFPHFWQRQHWPVVRFDTPTVPPASTMRRTVSGAVAWSYALLAKASATKTASI